MMDFWAFNHFLGHFFNSFGTDCRLRSKKTVWVYIYDSTHASFEDILVAKCVRHSSGSDCVIDCMSCWPNAPPPPAPLLLLSLQAQGEKCYFFKSPIWETQQPCNCEGKGRTTCQTKHLRGNLKYCKQWSNPLTVETGTWAVGWGGGERWGVVGLGTRCEREMLSDSTTARHHL